MCSRSCKPIRYDNRRNPRQPSEQSDNEQVAPRKFSRGQLRAANIPDQLERGHHHPEHDSEQIRMVQPGHHHVRCEVLDLLSCPEQRSQTVETTGMKIRHRYAERFELRHHRIGGSEVSTACSSLERSEALINCSSMDSTPPIPSPVMTCTTRILGSGRHSPRHVESKHQGSRPRSVCRKKTPPAA